MGTKKTNLILRAKKGDDTVEVEIPRDEQEPGDFVIPISRSPASTEEIPEPTGPEKRKPGQSDYEITRKFPQGAQEDENRQKYIEQELGLTRSRDTIPEKDQSYLASIDHLKQLYRSGRYEAALLETDTLIRDYPTNSRIYEMRGTLFEKIGHLDLAIQAWKQALRFNPSNESLRKFIERKNKKRSLASP
jgi:tetratricopeptide (TPR) repeat protein